MKPLIVIALCSLLAINTAAADIPGLSPDNSAETNGRAIADEAARRDNGFTNSRSDMTMTLFDGRGNSVARTIRSKTLEVADDGDRTILFFEDPADVRGTAFLTHSHSDSPSDQWLYLPALKRVKRIAANRRNGAFMSSEFSYEDLGNDEVDKYRYRLIGDAVFAGVDCFHIERIPTEQSGYSRQEVWLDKAELRLLKADYYDRGGALLKTLIAKDHQQYGEQYWRPAEMIMSNVQNGRRTILQWRNYSFDNEDVVALDFSPGRLDSIR
ncbi:MAG: outer membrane lipoprotein-sorting protein [Woeseiaceae bacterium]